MELVRYEVDGAVGRVTIDRVDRHNALNYQVMAELMEAHTQLKKDLGEL